jgi:hypothetical protein
MAVRTEDNTSDVIWCEAPESRIHEGPQIPEKAAEVGAAWPESEDEGELGIA